MSSNGLKELWISHGFPAGKRLFEIAKAKGLAITQKAVNDFVKAQEVHQLHARAPKPAVSHPITASSPQLEWQMDLLDMSKYSRQNAGYNWIALFEDVFSRRSYAEAIKTKQPTSVLPALQNAIEQLGKPFAIVSDNGTEFEGVVSKWCADHNIARRKTEVGNHRVLGLVDSLSRFYKNALHKFFTHSQSTRYLEYLPQLVENYNHTPHSSLNQMSPDEAEKDQTTTRAIHYAKKMNVTWKPKFKPGNKVRLLKKKSTFDRGYELRFSLEIFTIDKLDGVNYVLNDGRHVPEYRLISAGKATDDAKLEQEHIDQEAKEEEVVNEPPLKDIARAEKFSHRTGQILKHKEGVAQENRRSGLRERKPASQLYHSHFGKINW